MAEISLLKSLSVDGSLHQKISRFMQKLMENPATPGLHIEPVKNSRDPRVRTGRVDDQYRAILFEVTNKYRQHFVLTDVLNHDDAYAKARRIRLHVEGYSSAGALPGRLSDLNTPEHSKGDTRFRIMNL